LRIITFISAIILLAFAIIVLPSSLLSQSIQKKDKTDNLRNISFGVGLTKAFRLKDDLFGNNDIRFAVSSVVTLRLVHPIYIEIGLDYHKEELTGYSDVADINLLFAFGNNAFNKKITYFLAAGGTTSLYLGHSGGIILGLLFSTKFQYNFSNRFSLGIEFQHPNYLGQNYTNYLLIRSYFYLSIKF